MRTPRQKLLDNGIDDDVMLIDDDTFCESLIGVTMLPGPRAVYSYDRMVDEFCERHHVAPEDAADYISYNVVRALGYLGSEAPIVIDELDF